MKATVTASHVDVGYEKKTVISDVNISGLKGQIICLLGPNGAGKSTILRTLSGILAPIKGSILIDNQDLMKIKKKELSKKMALVLTDSISPGMMTVEELVSMGRIPYTSFMGRLTEEDQEIVKQAINTVGASNLIHRYYDELSDGEKQKVMIARAIVQEPELIILDEPTSHLDIKHKVEVVRMLQDLVHNQNITVILSLHDIDLAIKGCQTVLMVNNGEVIAQGSPEEIIEEGTIQQLYGIKGARFNELLGSVEFNGPKRNDVFVTGGNGTGTHIFRALARQGIGIVAGILHENDTDLQIAKAVCNQCIIEKAFQTIQENTSNEAMSYVKHVKCVIDTGFPIGIGNEGNRTLLKKAIDNNKTVFTVRTKAECQKLFGDYAKKMVCCNSIPSLTQQVMSQANS